MAADRKLCVDGNCLTVWFIGGKLPCCLIVPAGVRRPPPGTVSTCPKFGVVALWINSAGGGEVGLGGGTSRSRDDMEEPGLLRSGINVGGHGSLIASVTRCKNIDPSLTALL